MKTEPPATPRKPEPKESSEEPPPGEPSIEAIRKMSQEDIRKWVKSLWKDYGRMKLSPVTFKNLVADVLYKTSTPPEWKIILGIVDKEFPSK